MAANKQYNKRWYHSIHFKVLFILTVLFAFIIILVVFLIQKQAYPQIQAESNKLIIETGQDAVHNISHNLNSVERTAYTLAKTASVLPLDEQVINDAMGQILDPAQKDLVSALGLWPKLYGLNPEVEKLPLFYRLKEGQYQPLPILQVPLYQQYQDTPWFRNAQVIKPYRCAWSNSIQSHISKENLANSCLMRVERDGEFFAAVTISMELQQIAQTLERLQQVTGGYIVLIDNSNQIVASSDAQKVPYILSGDDGAKVNSLKNFTENNPSFQPVNDYIARYRDGIIKKAESQVPANLIEGLYAFDRSSNILLGSSIVNFAAYQQDKNLFVANPTDTLDTIITYNNDGILGENAQAYVFTVPETLWHMVIIKPESEITAVANSLSKTLLLSLLSGLLITAILLYLFLNQSTLAPIRHISNRMRQAATYINRRQYDQLHTLHIAEHRMDEIGTLGSSINTLLNRVEGNEGKLASVNQQLERKVEERTTELRETLKELKASQVQLIRSEKMATLGQMVAGVAHEVNTPLSYVQNNLEIIHQVSEQYEELIMMITELKNAMGSPEATDEDVEQLLANIISLSQDIEEDDLSEELKELIKDSLFGVEQITEMVLNLRDFTRLDESKVKKVDIRECIDASLKVARNTIKYHNVQMQLDDVPQIHCSPSQINQVLVNLFNNAAHAIGDKADGLIKIRTHADNSYVYIDIGDNGCGMSAEVLDKLFEPFFTTKGAGEGTGLGMAICQQIMEQHEGQILVDSQEGEGTTFTLVFPIDNYPTDIA